MSAPVRSPHVVAPAHAITRLARQLNPLEVYLQKTIPCLHWLGNNFTAVQPQNRDKHSPPSGFDFLCAPPAAAFNETLYWRETIGIERLACLPFPGRSSAGLTDPLLFVLVDDAIDLVT
jgi:hypothetical protein